MKHLTTQTNASCILVVEDHASIRGFIAGHLRDAGYEVLEAGSGEEAIDVLRATDHLPISLVFTDIQLGGPLTGWDVADAFRKALPDIPVIYTSIDPEPQQASAQKRSFLSPTCPPTLSNYRRPGRHLEITE